jgi:hypothetical protein
MTEKLNSSLNPSLTRLQKILSILALVIYSLRCRLIFQHIYVKMPIFQKRQKIQMMEGVNLFNLFLMSHEKKLTHAGEY